MGDPKSFMRYTSSNSKMPKLDISNNPFPKLSVHATPSSHYPANAQHLQASSHPVSLGKPAASKDTHLYSHHSDDLIRNSLWPAAHTTSVTSKPQWKVTSSSSSSMPHVPLPTPVFPLSLPFQEPANSTRSVRPSANVMTPKQANNGLVFPRGTTLQALLSRGTVPVEALSSRPHNGNSPAPVHTIVTVTSRKSIQETGTSTVPLQTTSTGMQTVTPSVSPPPTALPPAAVPTKTEPTTQPVFPSCQSLVLNQRLHNVRNFPKYRGRHFDRRLTRNGITLCPKTTMRMLQEFLQKQINQEVDKVLEDFMQQYFHRALANIRHNLGEAAFTHEDLGRLKYRIMKQVMKAYLPPGGEDESEGEEGDETKRGPHGTSAKATHSKAPPRPKPEAVPLPISTRRSATPGTESIVDSSSASECSSLSSHQDEEHISLPLVPSSPPPTQLLLVEDDDGSCFSNIIPWSEVIGEHRLLSSPCDDPHNASGDFSSALSSRSNSVLAINASIAAYCLLNGTGVDTEDKLPTTSSQSPIGHHESASSFSSQHQSRKRKATASWIKLSEQELSGQDFLRRYDGPSPPPTALPAPSDVFFTDMDYLLSNGAPSPDLPFLNGLPDPPGHTSLYPFDALGPSRGDGEASSSPPVLYRYDTLPSTTSNSNITDSYAPFANANTTPATVLSPRNE